MAGLQGPVSLSLTFSVPSLPVPSIRCLPAGCLSSGFPEGLGPICPHLCGPRLPGSQPAEEAAGAKAAEVCQASGAFPPEPLV